jgi:NhaB family Na+:H+ antiporter
MPLQAFLGSSPTWFKLLVVALLAGDVLLHAVLTRVWPESAGFVLSWMVVIQFIAFLAMALKCYPLLPGGLLALVAVCLGLTTPEHAYAETHRNFPVILLLIFVVAGVVFLKELLAAAFTTILLSTRSKVFLALLFVAAGALLSAFLDALTVTAVVITVCTGFYDVYMSHRSLSHVHDEQELAEFRAFLRSLVMHAVVGTALGGVTTVVGEPQNLLIAHIMSERLPEALREHWSFVGFAIKMGVVTMPTMLAGFTVAVWCERLRICGYGAQIPETVRTVLIARVEQARTERSRLDRYQLRVQAVAAVLLALGLVLHLAEVGLIGLALIVVTTAFCGINDEHRIGHAFKDSLPFTALLVVFFCIIAVIADQRLFAPVVRYALDCSSSMQVMVYFFANALLSSVSDNVFVATVFINEASAAYGDGRLSAEQFERLAIATNCGTNIPSVATPNGQAALLFLLTSPLAGAIQLGYGRMLWMAVPYAVVLTGVSAATTFLFIAK